MKDAEIDQSYKLLWRRQGKTIRFLDRMVKAGVTVFKIEGRARGPEYVYTVVQCYKEALDAALNGTTTEQMRDQWDERLATVFNRGFWDGYYLGQTLGELNSNYGSNATERKVYVGRGVKYFSKIGVAEFLLEAASLDKGDRLLITGPTTGAVYVTADEMRYDYDPIDHAEQGRYVSIAVPEKVRPSDKLFKIVKHENEKR